MILGREAGNENGTGADNGSCTGSNGDEVLEDGCAPADRRRDDFDDLDDKEGVRGSDENRFRFVVKLFLKLLGGGLGVSLRTGDREGEWLAADISSELRRSIEASEKAM